MINLNLVEIETDRWTLVEPEVPSITIIQGNPAHGRGTTIPIAIGNIQKFKSLRKDDFASIFKIINETTLTENYPGGCSRANHDGTHSARQARMLQILLEKIPQTLSENEQNCLTLAAYLLRAGRVDESSHTDSNPDDYYTRSALIFEAYASQCDMDPEIVRGLTKVINNSCKPEGIRETVIDENPKYKLWWDCLTIVHELDLIRCFSKNTIDGRIKGQVQTHLTDIGVNHPEELMEILFGLSKELCKITGCSRVYDHHNGDQRKFAICSADGDACWQIVSTIQ